MITYWVHYLGHTGLHLWKQENCTLFYIEVTWFTPKPCRRDGKKVKKCLNLVQKLHRQRCERQVTLINTISNILYDRGATFGAHHLVLHLVHIILKGSKTCIYKSVLMWTISCHALHNVSCIKKSWDQVPYHFIYLVHYLIHAYVM